MSTGTELEIISKEQGQLIDAARSYLESFDLTVSHQKGYGFLIGATLNQLKEVTPHGKFDALKEAEFPKHSRSALGRFMMFAEALSSAKNPTVGFLKNGQLLLGLPDEEKEKLFVAVEEQTGEKGILETVREFQKKKLRAKTRALPPPTPEDIAKQQREAANSRGKELIQKLSLFRLTTEAGTMDDVLFDELRGELIEVGKFMDEIKRLRKARK